MSLISKFQDVWDFVFPVLRRFFSDAGHAAIVLAGEAVMQAQSTGGSSKDKFNTAVAYVEQRIAAQGFSVLLADINWAVETAYQKYILPTKHQVQPTESNSENANVVSSNN